MKKALIFSALILALNLCVAAQGKLAGIAVEIDGKEYNGEVNISFEGTDGNNFSVSKNRTFSLPSRFLDKRTKVEMWLGEIRIHFYLFGEVSEYEGKWDIKVYTKPPFGREPSNEQSNEKTSTRFSINFSSRAKLDVVKFLDTNDL